MDAGWSMKVRIPAKYVGVVYGLLFVAIAGPHCQCAGGYCSRLFKQDRLSFFCAQTYFWCLVEITFVDACYLICKNFTSVHDIIFQANVCSTSDTDFNVFGKAKCIFFYSFYLIFVPLFPVNFKLLNTQTFALFKINNCYHGYLASRCFGKWFRHVTNILKNCGNMHSCL